MKKPTPSFQDPPCARNAGTTAPRVGAWQNLEGFCCGMERFKPSRFVGRKSSAIGGQAESFNVHGYCFVNDSMTTSFLVDDGVMTSQRNRTKEF